MAGKLRDTGVNSMTVEDSVQRRSLVVTDASWTIVIGPGEGGASEGSEGSSASGSSGTSASTLPRQPAKHAAATRAVRTRIARASPRPAPPPTKSIRCPKMRPLFLALLSLAACSRVNSGQPIEHPVVPGAALGTGFSSLAGHTTGKCVVPKPVDMVRDRVDGLTEEIVYVHNKQELLSAIGYSGGVSFGLFGVGVNFGAESIDRKFQSTSTSFVVVQMRIKTSSRALGKYQLERHAAETLRRDGPGARAFGRALRRRGDEAQPAHGSRPPRTIATAIPASSSISPPPANAAVISCFSIRVEKRSPRPA